MQHATTLQDTEDWGVLDQEQGDLRLNPLSAMKLGLVTLIPPANLYHRMTGENEEEKNNSPEVFLYWKKSKIKV